MSRQISGPDLLHNAEKFKAFTGDNMNDVLKHVNSLQSQKSPSIDMLNTPTTIKPVSRMNYAQKQLVLER